MSSRLPGILHTSPDFEGPHYDVIMQEARGVEEPIPISLPREATSRPSQTREVAWYGLTHLGYGEVIRAHRALRAEGEAPTETAISQRLHEDETLAERLTEVQERELTFKSPRHWFDGHDNSCTIERRTRDMAEASLFSSFTEMLFRPRVGIAISSMQHNGVRQNEIQFTAQSDWLHRGLGAAAIPVIKTYFPRAKVAFEKGYERIPMPGHPDATPPDGFGDPMGRFIDFADMPDPDENAEAWAKSLAGQAHHFFEGPQYPEVATDPEFEALLTSIQKGSIRLKEMREAGGFTWDKMWQTAREWEKEHGLDSFGQRVVIYPRRAIGYRELFEHDASDGVAGPHTTFEGYIARTASANSGQILLIGGVLIDAEPDYIPEITHFKALKLRGVIGFYNERTMKSDLSRPAIAITGPSTRELPGIEASLEELSDTLDHYLLTQ